MADNGESGMNYDNIFIRMLSRVGDAMLLSILFVLSCVPIITIGAAFTSLYYTAMKGISGDDGYIWKFYTRSFKQNFKQATGMWMLFLVAFFILSVDIWFWMTQWKATGNALAKPFLFVSVVLLTLAVMTFIYTFALQAKFDNSWKVQLRNAFLLSIKNFPMTLLMLLTYLVIAWCFYYDIVISIIVYVLIGFGAVGYLWAYIMLRCFKPYLPEEDLHAHDESVLLHEVDEDLDEESGDTDNDAEQTVDDAPANDTETDADDESAEE